MRESRVTHTDLSRLPPPPPPRRAAWALHEHSLAAPPSRGCARRKKSRCPPWTNLCDEGRTHIDIAAPGFDDAAESTANVCASPQRLDTYITPAESRVCAAATSASAHQGTCGCGWTGETQQNCGADDGSFCWSQCCGAAASSPPTAPSLATCCHAMRADTPERMRLRRGCELFSSWGWQDGDPTLEAQPVECPAAFTALIADAFSAAGVTPLSSAGSSLAPTFSQLETPPLPPLPPAPLPLRPHGTLPHEASRAIAIALAVVVLCLFGLIFGRRHCGWSCCAKRQQPRFGLAPPGLPLASGPSISTTDATTTTAAAGGREASEASGSGHRGSGLWGGGMRRGGAQGAGSTPCLSPSAVDIAVDLAVDDEQSMPSSEAAASISAISSAKQGRRMAGSTGARQRGGAPSFEMVLG